MSAVSVLTQLSIYIFYILLPLLALYIAYLVITKAFNDMGFSEFEAIIIVFISFLLGYGLADGIIKEYVGFGFSNVPLFSYDNWRVGINTGGAIIPIIISIYLITKNKLSVARVGIGILIVAIITFFVTRPDPSKGIVSSFPFWLLPVFCASIASIFLLWKNLHKAAPFAYVSGTIGVLIGADFLHLMVLLGTETQTIRNAVIGGAVVLDMVFITGLLAVILDGILMFGQKKQN